MGRQIIKVKSADNNFQHVEVVKRNREKRHRYGKFFVEGVSAINLALQYRWKFDTLIFSSERKQSKWAKEIIEKSKAQTYLDVSSSLLEQLSDKEESSEILALLSMQDWKFSDITPSEKGLILVFDRPSSPGNLGTLIRSADAFGADAVVVSGHAVDPFDTQVLRASVGTFFAKPVIRIESHEQLKGWHKQTAADGINYKIVGTSAKGDAICQGADLSGPIVLLIGNETVGLSRAYKEMSELLIKIPISGVASSLNASCAASIMLYEIQRQRTSRGN